MASDPRFEAIPSLTETISLKWGKHPPDVLPLWVADMDFPVAAPIAEALESYVGKGFFGYPLHSYYDNWPRLIAVGLLDTTALRSTPI